MDSSLNTKLLIVIILGLLEAVSKVCAGTKPRSSSDYRYTYNYNMNDNYKNYDSNYGGASNDYKVEDYGVVVQPEPQPTLRCYVCTYHMIEGSPSGPETCRHHFSHNADILRVDCEGMCVISYHMTDSTNYMFSRQCMRDCINKESSSGYRRCCMGDLCNTAVNNATWWPTLLISIGATILRSVWT